MADKSTAEGKQLVDLGGGVFAEKVVAVSTTGTDIAGGGGGGASTIADGADVAQGAVADAVVAAGASGSLSAKLRRLTTDISALLGRFGTRTAADALALPTAPDVVAQLNAYDGTAGYLLRVLSGGVQTTKQLGVALMLNNSGSSWTPAVDSANVADGSNGASSIPVTERRWNGTSWDKARATVEATALASGARTTTQTVADIVTYNAQRLRVVLDMTVVGTGSVTLTINGKDAASGKYYLILAGAAVTTNSTNVYTVYPGATVAANVSANDLLPRIIQLVITANNANSATYSLGYVLAV